MLSLYHSGLLEMKCFNRFAPPAHQPYTLPTTPTTNAYTHLTAREGDGFLENGPSDHLVASGRGQRTLITEEKVPVFFLRQEGREGYFVVWMELGSCGKEGAQ